MAPSARTCVGRGAVVTGAAIRWREVTRADCDEKYEPCLRRRCLDRTDMGLVVAPLRTRRAGSRQVCSVLRRSVYCNASARLRRSGCIMNRLIQGVLSMALPLMVVLCLPGQGAAHASILPQRPPPPIELRSDTSFLAVAAGCGPAAESCVGRMPLLRVGRVAGSDRNANGASNAASSTAASARSSADPEEPARVLMGSVGLVLLGCAARLRETRRRRLRLLDPRAR